MLQSEAQSDFTKLLIHEITEYYQNQLARLESAKVVETPDSKTESDFVENICHEIQAPVNAVIGLSYLMQNTGLDKQQQYFMTEILHSNLHLMTVLSNILYFSKIKSHKLELEQHEFNLQLLLDDVIALMSAKAADQSLKLRLEIDPAVPIYLRGDLMRLNHILVNYVDNAIKFTNKKGVIVIEVQLKQDDEKEALLCFSVQDKGIGLTKEQQSLIFKRFQQVDISNTRKYGGTNLGLIVSKNLVEMMGGEVGVISEYGQGSTFWFTARLVNIPPQKA